MLPFDTVNSPGFQLLVNTFEPRYQQPDRKTISNPLSENKISLHNSVLEIFAIENMYIR